MKKKYILLVALLAFLAFFLWWHKYRLSNQPVQEPPVANDQTNLPTMPSQTSQRGVVPVAPLASNLIPPTNVGAWIEQQRKQMEEAQKQGLNEWRTPIEFYGKVVDENTNSVASANIHFVWTDLSATGNSDQSTTSDGNGLFSLAGVTGKNLIVEVSKQGYYAHQEFAAFNYAGENQNFVPDANNPVIFRLKKKGIAEPLMVWDKNFQISISGKPLQIDLRTGDIAASGEASATMTFVKHSPETPGRSYDWTFTTSIPGGGLLPSIDQFEFIAPASGYAPSDQIEMPSSLGEKWQARLKQTYFVKLPNGHFARIILELMSHNGSLRIQSFLNPSDSRNLEYDPNLRIANP